MFPCPALLPLFPQVPENTALVPDPVRNLKIYVSKSNSDIFNAKFKTSPEYVNLERMIRKN